MYRCEACGAVFDDPVTVTESRPDADGFSEQLSYWICPECGDDGFFQEVDECPECGEWMPRCNILCDKCRDAVRDKFCKFCDELSADELKVLDEMLEGNSLDDRETFQ